MRLKIDALDTCISAVNQFYRLTHTIGVGRPRRTTLRFDSELGKHRSLDECQLALALKRGHGAIKIDEDVEIVKDQCIIFGISQSAFAAQEFESFLHVHPCGASGRGSGLSAAISIGDTWSTYTGIIVETCTASTVSATLMRRNMVGPWAEDGPSDEDRTGVVPKRVLVSEVGTGGGASPDAGTVDPFPGAVIMRDGRRCILLSSCSFCWTTNRQINIKRHKKNGQTLSGGCSDDCECIQVEFGDFSSSVGGCGKQWLCKNSGSRDKSY